MNRFFPLFFSIICLSAGTAFGQGTQTDFGKNRIQYKSFDWKYYESDHFLTYWYEGGRTLGEFAIQISERDFRELQYILEYRLLDKIKIMVYNELDDLKQTNLGNEETFYQIGGATRVVGKTIFVYFNGDKNHLRKQIREGISQVYLNQMMFGGNLQEVVQNAVLLNLPEWFTSGLIAYVGEEWNAELDNQMRDAILSGRYTDFFDVVNENPRLAGHSMWYFVAQNYGQSTVSNLLYLTRINRSIESGYLYVLGSTFRQTADAWKDYFMQRYQVDEAKGTAPEGRSVPIARSGKKKIHDLSYNPRGNNIAYSIAEAGKFKVYLHQTASGENDLIYSFGVKNPHQLPEDNYPVLAWSRNGAVLSIIYSQADKIKIANYSVSKGKTKVVSVEDKSLDRIIDADYSSNSKLLIAGIYAGQSDLFTIGQGGSGLKRLTRDAYDDRDVAYVNINGVNGALFTSNRDQIAIPAKGYKNYLKPKSFDVYFLPLSGDEKQVLRITDTPYADEHQLVQLDSHRIGFLSNENGIYNRMSAKVDTVITRYDLYLTTVEGNTYQIAQDSLERVPVAEIDTVFEQAVYEAVAFPSFNSNHTRNVENLATAFKWNKQAEVFLVNDTYELRISNTSNSAVDSIPNSLYREMFLDAKKTVEIETTPVQDNRLRELTPQETPPAKEGDSPVDFFFVDEFSEPKQPKPKKDTIPPAPTVIDTIPPKPEPIPEPIDTVERIDIDNYFFQSEFDNLEAPAAVIVEDENTGEIRLQNPKAIQPFVDPPFMPVSIDATQIKDYKLRFRTDVVSLTLNNDFFFRGLDSYAFNETFYEYPIPGIMLAGEVKDVMEDHVFSGAVRAPVNFDGIEYFFSYQNNRKRLDKEFSFYRRSRTETTAISSFNEFLTRQFNQVVEVKLSYPLSNYSSIRTMGILRTDRLSLLATEFDALNDPRDFWRFFPKLSSRGEELNNTRLNDYSIGGRVEFVFDNTTDVSVNIKNGTRYKVFAEVRKPFDLNILEPNDDFSFDFLDGINAQMGFDARHYYALDRFSILAGRLAATTSVGSIRNLYFLGGVDNWIFSDTNMDIPVRQDGRFAFQTLAAPLRGFSNNIRNGSSYVVFNGEARVPIFNYFSRHPLKSSFLRNFQLVAFFDMGTAWEGSSPFSDDNPLNTVVIGSESSPVEVRVEYFRNPIVMGLGGGIRTTLFGYVVKLDYAVGFETGVAQDPILYFSIGKDF